MVVDYEDGGCCLCGKPGEYCQSLGSSDSLEVYGPGEQLGAYAFVLYLCGGCKTTLDAQDAVCKKRRNVVWYVWVAASIALLIFSPLPVWINLIGTFVLGLFFLVVAFVLFSPKAAVAWVPTDHSNSFSIAKAFSL